MENYEEVAKKIKGKRETAKTTEELLEEKQKELDGKLKTVYETYKKEDRG